MMANDPRPSNDAIVAMIEAGHPDRAILLATIRTIPLVVGASFNHSAFEWIEWFVGLFS